MTSDPSFAGLRPCQRVVDDSHLRAAILEYVLPLVARLGTGTINIFESNKDANNVNKRL